MSRAPILVAKLTILLGICTSVAEEPHKGFFSHRRGPTKEKLLRAGGGNLESEAAVARGLEWIARQQAKDGSWKFDGDGPYDQVAATGLCLLPFLGAGETHAHDGKYKEVVARGIKFLEVKIRADGELSGEMYAQAVATIALCEAAGMTRDSKVKELARRAVDLLVSAQARDGSWGTTKNNAGNSSNTSWAIIALKTARLAEIPVPQKCFDQAGNLLDTLSIEEGSLFAREPKGNPHRSATAESLLCRMYTGATPRNEKLRAGMKWMAENHPASIDNFDLAYLFPAMRVFHFCSDSGDAEPSATWKSKTRDLLIATQTKTQGKADEKFVGSWPPSKGSDAFVSRSGRLGSTAMSCLTLEVYYLYMPLYKNLDILDDLKK